MTLDRPGNDPRSFCCLDIEFSRFKTGPYISQHAVHVFLGGQRGPVQLIVCGLSVHIIEHPDRNVL